MISYEELLAVYWGAHNPTTPSYSSQYASIVFYHDEEQKRLALETKTRQEAERGTIYTRIAPYTGFTLAEDYHQKYRLRRDAQLMQEFEAVYPDLLDFVNSTAAARVNGYLGGYGTYEVLESDLDQLGLSPSAGERLLKIASRRSR